MSTLASRIGSSISGSTLIEEDANMFQAFAAHCDLKTKTVCTSWKEKQYIHNICIYMRIHIVLLRVARHYIIRQALPDDASP